VPDRRGLLASVLRVHGASPELPPTGPPHERRAERGRVLLRTVKIVVPTNQHREIRTRQPRGQHDLASKPFRADAGREVWGKDLITTRRPRPVSVARKTRLIPPPPSSRSTVSRPRNAPGYFMGMRAVVEQWTPEQKAVARTKSGFIGFLNLATYKEEDISKIFRGAMSSLREDPAGGADR